MIPTKKQPVPAPRPLIPALAFALAAAGAVACTIVTPGGQDGGVKLIPIRPDALPPPRPLQASVLYVVNLERSSANLSDAYARIILGVTSYLKGVGLELENTGVIATYSDEYGPRLLLGRRTDAPPGPSLTQTIIQQMAAGGPTPTYEQLLPILAASLRNINDEDLPIALQLLAGSGRFDGDGETSEAKSLIRFGASADSEALPALLGGIERSALFDRPRNLFIVVHLQPLPRRCAFGSSDCLVDGRAVGNILTETDAQGNATWLKFAGGDGLPPQRIVHVAIATSELESLAAFRARCANVPGFPRNLFDVVAPSTNSYFTPMSAFLNSLHSGTGHGGDLCELMGSSPENAIKRLGSAVAAVAIVNR